MDSALYIGRLRHRRFLPKEHQFSYPLFMVLLDVDRIPEAMSRSVWSSYNRFNWASFFDRDHTGDPRLPLRERLRADASARELELPDGPIFLLTHLRYLGYCFNPISFFYCYDRTGHLQLAMAEVHNTFGESRNYWLSNPLHSLTRKTMHVSPFMGMEQEYAFRLSEPGARLTAHMEVLDRTLTPGRTYFDATLMLERRPWDAAGLLAMLLRHPWMSARVIFGIHWKALRLYLKKVPVYTHPGRIGKPA